MKYWIYKKSVIEDINYGNTAIILTAKYAMLQ